MAPEGETSVVAEIPCFPDDDADRLADDDLASRVVDELAALGLLNPADVVERRHHRIPNAYPVYSIDYARDTHVVQTALASISNLDTLGRAGRFVYSHLHDQLRFGKDYVLRPVAPHVPGIGLPALLRKRAETPKSADATEVPPRFFLTPAGDSTSFAPCRFQPNPSAVFRGLPS
jgi:hypothetical protein